MINVYLIFSELTNQIVFPVKIRVLRTFFTRTNIILRYLHSQASYRKYANYGKGFNENQTRRYLDYTLSYFTQRKSAWPTETMLSPNSQKSVHVTSESQWESETSTPKLFCQNELSKLTCD